METIVEFIIATMGHVIAPPAQLFELINIEDISHFCSAVLEFQFPIISDSFSFCEKIYRIGRTFILLFKPGARL